MTKIDDEIYDAVRRIAATQAMRSSDEQRAHALPGLEKLVAGVRARCPERAFTAAEILDAMNAVCKIDRDRGRRGVVDMVRRVTLHLTGRDPGPTKPTREMLIMPFPEPSPPASSAVN